MGTSGGVVTLISRSEERVVRFVALVAVLFAMIGCTGSDASSTPTPSAPAIATGMPLLTPEGGTSTATSTPEPTATPREGTSEMPTGFEIVDRVIEAVEAQDAAALAALMRTQQVPCSARSPMGGLPGDCAGLPKDGVSPRAPDEVVEVFPEAGCELELDEGDVAAIAERTLPHLYQLWAVVRFDEPVFESEPYYPESADYGVIFAGAAVGNATPVARLLVTYEDAVVYLDSTCGGGPEEFLDPALPYRSAVVIARGPAFEE